jgi:hypothetical protein
MIVITKIKFYENNMTNIIDNKHARNYAKLLKGNSCKKYVPKSLEA